MKKLFQVTKVTKMLKISEILTDLSSDMTDEDLLTKYQLSWKQLEKTYRKLFYGGYLTSADMIRRIVMRAGQDSSHIPFVEIDDAEAVYECEICGYTSIMHFSTCPRCHKVNLRRLTRRISSPESSASSFPHSLGT